MHTGQDQVNILEVYHVIKIFVLSIFEWPLKTGFTVHVLVEKLGFYYQTYLGQ